MSGIEYSVIKSDVIKSFDCSLKYNDLYYNKKRIKNHKFHKYKNSCKFPAYTVFLNMQGMSTDFF